MDHTVLLVDDDIALLEALRRAFRREPYSIRVADGAAAAFQILAHQTVDVVVSDEKMPGLSGTDFLAKVRAELPDTIRIILTGSGNFEVALRAINEGSVYRFLQKPCNPMELALAIRQGLQQRTLLAESRRLLHTLRRQSAAMDSLDREARGITHVDRDEAGAIVLSDVPVDFDLLVQEAEAEIACAEARMRDREAAIRRRGEEMLRERRRAPRRAV
jgi:DNA-binding NtrC family response regulator